MPACSTTVPTLAPPGAPDHLVACLLFEHREQGSGHALSQ
jgi:hypothetical protein